MSKQEIVQLKEQIEKYEYALQTIRDFCRDTTLHNEVKLLDIYHEASKTLDRRLTLLRDMRSGKK